MAEKIAEQVKMPYHHSDGDIRIGCCIGVAFYPEDGEDAETVIRNAGAAMRQARHSGVEYYFYNPATHRRRRRSWSLKATCSTPSRRSSSTSSTSPSWTAAA